MIVDELGYDKALAIIRRTSHVIPRAVNTAARSVRRASPFLS